MSTMNQCAQPSQVSTAVRLLYFTILLGVIRLILEPEWLHGQMPLGAVLTIQAFSIAIVGMIVYMISRGKHWARIVFLILFIPGLPLAIMPLIHSLSANPFSGILGVLQTVGQIAAAALLFHRESSAWFQAMKTGVQTADHPPKTESPG
ncbi:hypothetical protein VA7868_00385 [Vibrio aerogenes CECT 7868]|uniref:Uncharacterized protein n=1 Tax=Vibrio aerogenes CECT 7868 TaxID=1216006 RepID=A0A1M5VGR3_9VIBR|nr:hypothetical protein [Vibrio aerogenes]SHH74416.1 hypothetical protein VA7868_00385 [Vibrio aerogenes CECT 7868]